jgi:hypothetical protein
MQLGSVMDSIEKIYLLKFLYDSSDNAYVLDYLYQNTIQDNDKMVALRNSIEKDVFLGRKGKCLLEKGKAVYEKLLSSPASIEMMDNMLTDYLYDKQGNCLTIDKMTTCLTIRIDDYSLVSERDCNVILRFYKEYYKAMLYSALVFGGKKGVESLPEYAGDDIYNWIAYFQNCHPFIQINKQNTWIIYWHNYPNNSNTYNLSGYEIVYYNGQEKYNSLISESDMLQYAPYIWGPSSSAERSNRRIIIFGLGNITNIINANVESVYHKKVYYELPKKGTLSDVGLCNNPFITLENFFGNKEVLYCITPEQYLGLCRATMEYNGRRVRGMSNVCPVCNAVLNSGLKICPRHSGS